MVNKNLSSENSSVNKFDSSTSSAGNICTLLSNRRGEEVQGLLTLPRSGDGPTVLLLSRQGSRESILAWCRRFSEEGYITVAPDLDTYDRWQLAREDDHPQHDALLNAVLGVSGDRVMAKPSVGVLGLHAGAALALEIASNEAVGAIALFTGEDEVRSLPATACRCPGAVHVACAKSGGDLADLWRRLPGLAVFTYPNTGVRFADPTHPDWDVHASAIAHSRTLAVLRPALGPLYDLAALFQEHLAHEFIHKDPDATMRTMVEQPYVNHVPTLTGGYGHDMLKRFYKYHFIPTQATDRTITVISESVTADTVVLEVVLSFKHDKPNDFLLPGVAPTGKEVQIPSVMVAKFRGDKLYREHIYWDQASVLAQLGLIDPAGLPVSGAEQAEKMLDPSRPSNDLMHNWEASAGKPI
jgi:carboxymethylenebutenolidase